ncbi:RnfABCDGE type electron transport complex subunit B [Facilibium subflavum]|uniref:RnfABCDGE type electron transport complex subunit B n=1 Tax=Facilibium subflavum TaxID=2219058 RepID=UPI000E659973|nr:RnfABCDGE type electron transport complex subunit B [Facilibium subflavum]
MQISIESIDALLPQTQCTKCGYKDCYDYARAIYHGQKHNRCPPGGDKGIKALSEHLNRPVLPLDQSCGSYQPKKVAVINEDLCIGCKKCILACPVDAIVGAKKQMHSVLSDDCTGCDLCVEPCPMDCIDMLELPQQLQPEQMSSNAYEKQKNAYRQAHQAQQKRLETKQNLAKEQHQKNVNFEEKPLDKKAYIQQALANFKKKKQNISK